MGLKSVGWTEPAGAEAAKPYFKKICAPASAGNGCPGRYPPTSHHAAASAPGFPTPGLYSHIRFVLHHAIHALEHVPSTPFVGAVRHPGSRARPRNSRSPHALASSHFQPAKDVEEGVPRTGRAV